MINHIKEYLKFNWKNILIAALIITQVLSVLFGWNGYSLVIGFKTGTANANLEFNDIELDSTDDMTSFDIYNFKPKAPQYIAVHCTASKEGRNLRKEDLLRIFDERGFSRPGYNYVVDINGTIIDLLPLNSNSVIDIQELCQGVKNHNSTTISICYIGGYDKNMKAKDTRTWAQKLTMAQLLVKLKKQFPKAKIVGHRDFNGVHKECPVFDAISEYAWIK